jgi:hypothetical protein
MRTELIAIPRPLIEPSAQTTHRLRGAREGAANVSLPFMMKLSKHGGHRIAGRPLNTGFPALITLLSAISAQTEHTSRPASRLQAILLAAGWAM